MISTGALNGLWIIPILGFLILIHEIGHYVAARMCGVTVEEFGLGLPPRLFGFTRKGTIWSINALPFGGFVRVKGEDGKNEEPDSMPAQPPLQRLFFLSAGVIMNLLAAIVLMIVLIGSQGIPHSRTYIADVAPSSPAAAAGWMAGDRIVAINGKEMESADQIVTTTRGHGGEETTVTVERRGNLVDTILIPREHPPKGQGRVGVSLQEMTSGEVTVQSVAPGSAAEAAGLQVGDQITVINNREVADSYVLQTELERYAGAPVPVTYVRDGQTYETTIAVPTQQVGQTLIFTTGFQSIKTKPVYEQVPALQIIPKGFQRSWESMNLIFAGIKTMFTQPETLTQVAGPIGMGQLTSELIEESTLPVWITLMNLTIVLSLSLAFLNLLPIPGLDGGRIIFVLLEILRGGKKVAPEKEGLVHLAGIVVLICLMLVVAFSDIRRIVTGGSFLQ